MSGSTWTFSQEFYATFQTSRTDLETRIDSAKNGSSSLPPDVLQGFSLELSKLTKSLADATGSLPSYDQRQCELQLKALEKTLDALRTSSAPKSKFSFKRKAAAAPSIPSELARIPDPLELPDRPTIQSNTPSNSTSNLSLSSRSHCYLSLDSFPPSSLSSPQSDLTISDLESCIVNLIPKSITHSITSSPNTASLDISALHIRNLTNTVLLLPAVHGSVLLHDLTRCVVVVGCHQFRMHNSTNVDVYVSIPSNPVIEHCSGIRFAPYPASLSRNDLSHDSKHLSVQDFSHIRATPSPHWSILPHGSETIGDTWPVLTIDETESLKKALAGLLPAVPVPVPALT